MLKNSWAPTKKLYKEKNYHMHDAYLDVLGLTVLQLIPGPIYIKLT